METQAERRVRQKESSGQDMSRRIYRVRATALLDSLRAIGRAGTRLPALTVGGYRIGLAPSNGRLYASVDSEPRYLGEIRNGIFRPEPNVSEQHIESVRAIVERTVEVVRAVAATIKDPKCPICNQLLNPRDRKRGFGPACWEKGLFNTYERRTIAGQQR